MIEITMPQLAESMTEGVVLSWLATPGSWIEGGDELVEIETDKATMTHPAEASGVLEILASEGETVAVGAVIARLDPDGSETADELEGQPAPTEAPAGGEESSGADDAAGPPAPSGPPDAEQENREQRPTPLARRVALRHGVSISSVTGTGPGGRVTKGDVLDAIGIGRTPSPVSGPAQRVVASGATSSQQDPGAPAKGETKVEHLSRVQQTIARRMAEAKATVPHIQVETEVSLDALTALRTSLNGLGDEIVPSINDFMVRACALALRDHPRANGSYRDGEFVLHSRINIGVAVATDNALVVPVVVDADHKTLGEIAREVRAMAARVRSGEITPPELAGGTFTISNLGMYGVTALNPVVNPPQAAILGVGAAREQLRRSSDGEITDSRIATLTLSCDHRILYGADAALLLSSIRERLEAPLSLVL